MARHPRRTVKTPRSGTAPTSNVEHGSTLDECGRVTIRREYRDRLGDRFVQVLTPRGVLLRPVPQLLPGKKGPSALEASGERAAADGAGR